MNKQLEADEDWVLANKMTLNVLKTEYMIKGTSQRLMKNGAL